MEGEGPNVRAVLSVGVEHVMGEKPNGRAREGKGGGGLQPPFCVVVAGKFGTKSFKIVDPLARLATF